MNKDVIFEKPLDAQSNKHLAQPVGVGHRVQQAGIPNFAIAGQLALFSVGYKAKSLAVVLHLPGASLGAPRPFVATEMRKNHYVP